jgi:predicted  nucleic acid-binding Zn-ribbon protein
LRQYSEANEENESLRQSLGRSDDLVESRNQEISALNSRLAAKDETISDLGEQIGRLESELASREPTQPETSATVETDLSEIEPADLLNQLKGRRKKSKADLADVAAILELLGDR